MRANRSLKTYNAQRDPLPKNFKCVFCNHETAVSVKIDKKNGVGSLSCKSCGQNYQTGVNCMYTRPPAGFGLAANNALEDLSDPVDVYADWIDACESVAKDTSAARGPAPPSSLRQSQPQSRAGLAPGEKYTAEDDGFIDDEDAEADFADD